MIIARYLFKELSVTLVAVTSVLFLIFVSSWFARLLGQVASGGIHLDVIFLLLSLKSLDALMLLLPLAFYLSVLLAFGRLYKDSEMTAMMACGVSPLTIVKQVFWFSLLFALIIGFISLYLSPWAKGERFKIQNRLDAATGLEAVAGGQFREMGDGRVVFYAERLSDDGRTMENVFIRGEREGVENVVMAKRAYRVDGDERGVRYLVLEDGHRYEGNPGEADFRIVSFREHGLRLTEREVVFAEDRTSAKSTWALLHSDQRGDQAELQWRISMPVSAVLLSVLAVFLSKTNPRQGRYAKFFVGILVYVFYSNLLGVARAWVEKGKVPPEVGMWWVHLMLVVVLIILVLRLYAGQRAAERIAGRPGTAS